MQGSGGSSVDLGDPKSNGQINYLLHFLQNQYLEIYSKNIFCCFRKTVNNMYSMLHLILYVEIKKTTFNYDVSQKIKQLEWKI